MTTKQARALMRDITTLATQSDEHASTELQHHNLSDLCLARDLVDEDNAKRTPEKRQSLPSEGLIAQVYLLLNTRPRDTATRRYRDRALYVRSEMAEELQAA